MSVSIHYEENIQQKPTLMIYSYIMSFLVLVQIICDTVALLTISLSPSIHLSASGVIFPIAFAMIGITANIYGAERAKRIIIAMTLAQFIFCFTVYLFAILITSNSIEDNGVANSFINYFKRYWTVTAAGLIDTFLPLWICSILTSKCKKLFTSKKSGLCYTFPIIGYLLTIFIPLVFSQLSLVLITYSINFGLGVGVSLSDLLNIITSTYIYKLIIGLTIAIFLTKPLIKLCRLFDKMDTYDYNVSYSVFPKTGNNGINLFNQRKNENTT